MHKRLLNLALTVVVLGCESEQTVRGDARAPLGDGGVADAGGDASTVSEEPFFADLFADINGRQKRFKYTFAHPASGGQGMTVEFSTGFRPLGAEAVLGEGYSELWLTFGVVGSAEMPGPGTYNCRPKPESAAPGTRWARLVWSFNHGIGGSTWRGFHTDGEVGSCTLTIASFDRSPGGSFRATFFGRLDGDVSVTDGSVNLTFPKVDSQLP